ncbi:MAG: DUF4974 domain-containing protein [Bacteroidaceae bacterium]|nr:DUF4974 domain-containing protein [Bacteroidaceae bacterium]
MKNTERRTIGAGAWEALRRQRERAERLPVSDGLEEKVMGRVATESQHTEQTEQTEPTRQTEHLQWGWVRVWHVAASVVLLIGGIAFAAVVMNRSNRAENGAGENRDSVAAYMTTVAKGIDGTVVAFEGVRLDSIMLKIGAYYGRRVCFREAKMKSLRIHTKWNRREPLAVFIESMNELDGLRISDERDTLFVMKGGEE